MNQLYQYIAISRQAIDQYGKRQLIFDNRIMCLLTEAEALRREHPGCGLEKMYTVDTLAITAPCIVWQSDITYYDVNDTFYYAVFIIDVYTK